MTGQTPRTDEDWLHAMRNAVNAALFAAVATRSALDAGDPGRAYRFLDESEHACGMAAALLRGDAPPGADVRSPSSGPEDVLRTGALGLSARAWRRPG